MSKNPYVKKEKKVFLHTFNRQPLLIKKAKDAFVWDEKGKKYWDFYSGLAVCGVGHNDKNVVKAIKRQSDYLLHCSNFFYTKPQFELAKQLTSRAPNTRVFFSNSGAEANELAIKLARLWAFKNKKKGREILTFKNSFHGRTLATSAASGGKWGSNPAFQPYPKGFRSVQFNNLLQVKKAIKSKTIAVLVEPVQGEGGIHVATREFLKGLATICRKKNILLIADEIQTGMGRSGKFFAFEHYGVKPDIITMAKGLAGGMPLGATLAKTSIAQYMKPGLHGSTFGGNPVACAASLEVLKRLSPRSIQSIHQTGLYLKEKLTRFIQYPTVKTIRGLGLLLAIELDVNGAPYVDLARRKGLLINCTQGNVLRFLPAYFLNRSDLDRCLNILHSVFENLSGETNG